MIPLLLLTLGVGVALIAYEVSPKAHARIDDYARAIREAHEAHAAADAHLGNAEQAHAVAVQNVQAAVDAHRSAQEAPPSTPPAPPTPVPSQPVSVPTPAPVPAHPAPVPTPVPAPVPAPPPTSTPPPPPSPALAPTPSPVPAPPPTSPVADAHSNAAAAAVDAGTDHAVNATIANQEAAQNTADAAKAAKNADERRAVAESAAKVDAREKKILAAYNNLGVTQCAVRTYPHVTAQIRDVLLTKLHGEGMAVTGDNPWNIDTHLADVKLRAAWNPKTQTLKLIVLAQAPYVSCDMIWERIDPKVKGIIGP